MLFIAFLGKIYKFVGFPYKSHIMSDAKTYIIPDIDCERAGMAFEWLPGDKLSLYANQHISKYGSDRPSILGKLNDGAKIHEIRLDILLFHPIVRKLVNESSGVFLIIQKTAAQLGKDSVEARLELITLSKQYRCIIKACIENLQEDATASNDPAETATLLNLVKIFYNIEFLWHLCEIFYVDVTPGSTVLPQMLEWVQFHFFQCEQRAIVLLSGESQSDTGLETEPDYWDTITDLILQGRTKTVCALLRLHSEAGSPAFKTADLVLRTMPFYQVYGGLSAVEFLLRWRCWQNEARDRLQSEVFVADKSLEFIMQLVTDEEAAWDVVAPRCETWFQHMAARLLYSEPTVKSFDLCYHAKRSLARFGGSERMQHTDYVMLALLESDLYLAIKLIEQSMEHGWFAAHLTDLLYRCGCLDALENQNTNMASQLHESLLLDYGTLLMGHESLWQLGATYLDHCVTEGRPRLELLLSRVRIPTESHALKVIHIAKQRGLHDIAAGVCKVMGRRSQTRRRPGNALTWALRAQDTAYATSLAMGFLREYAADGTMKATDLLENLGPCIMLSEKLTFLGKYCEFHQLYRASRFTEAAKLLVSLIEARLGPKAFWANLLLDAVPLLETPDFLIPAEDVCKLMACTDELTQDPDTDKSVSANMDFVRLALLRAVDKAIANGVDHLAVNGRA